MRHLWLVGALLVGGCQTREVERADKKATGRGEGAARTARAPRPVGSTPKSVFEPGATERIQRALSDKGYDTPATGKMDDRTRKNLEAFQKEKKVAATGLPDIETLRKLGLEPDEVFQPGSRKKKDDATHEGTKKNSDEGRDEAKDTR
jgi:peptidoglycan hydrolase-like protein with peptidoglycan-binding domain